MGGVYSAEEMERKMLSLHLQNIHSRDRTTVNAQRRPFKLIRDNETQTDREVPEQPQCCCSCDIKPKEIKKPDDSHINFTSIYLACHNAPTKCFCDSFVQTDPVSVHSRGVQIGADLGADEYDNLTEDSPVPWTSESSDGGVGCNQQRRRRRRINSSLSVQKPNNESETELAIETKYISSFSDDDGDDNDDDGSLCLDTSLDDHDVVSYDYAHDYDYERTMVGLDGAQVDEENVGGTVVRYLLENEKNELQDKLAYFHNNEHGSMSWQDPILNTGDQVLQTDPSRQLSKWRRYSANIELNTCREKGDASVVAKDRKSSVNTWRKYVSGDGVPSDGHDDEMEQNRKQLMKCNNEDEFEIQHMLDVDYCWKCESLQQANRKMEVMVAQYGHFIKELSEQREDQLLADALSDSIHEKELLQMELNRAENSLMDSYSRIERLKTVVEKYKHNEESMKISLYDCQTKLSKSEGRYKKLKEHAIEKVEAANAEIARIFQDKETQVSKVLAELEKCRDRNKNLERELKEKADTNKELSQICDELIKKVSDE